jgi:hypothetical protein
MRWLLWLWWLRVWEEGFRCVMVVVVVVAQGLGGGRLVALNTGQGFEPHEPARGDSWAAMQAIHGQREAVNRVSLQGHSIASRSQRQAHAQRPRVAFVVCCHERAIVNQMIISVWWLH